MRRTAGGGGRHLLEPHDFGTWDRFSSLVYFILFFFSKIDCIFVLLWFYNGRYRHLKIRYLPEMYMSKVGIHYPCLVSFFFLFFFKQTRASWSEDMDYIEKMYMFGNFRYLCQREKVLRERVSREREREFQEREGDSVEMRVLRLRRAYPG